MSKYFFGQNKGMQECIVIKIKLNFVCGYMFLILELSIHFFSKFIFFVTAMGCFKINKGTDFKKVLVNGKVFSASVVFEGTFFISGTKKCWSHSNHLKKAWNVL